MRNFLMVVLVMIFSVLFTVSCENSTVKKLLPDNSANGNDNSQVNPDEDNFYINDDGEKVYPEKEVVADEDVFYINDDGEKIYPEKDVTADTDVIQVNDDPIVNDETVVQDNTTVIDNTVVPDDYVDVCAGFDCSKITNSHCDSASGKAACVCNTGYHMNSGQCVSDNTVTQTGTFTFSFTGVINANGTSPQSLKGGDGEAVFSHLGTDFDYKKQTIFGSLGFPLANDQQGQVAVLWIDKFSMGGSMKVFAVNLPTSVKAAGKFDITKNQTLIFYGDMSFSTQSMTIDCIRSIAGSGTYEVTAYSAVNLAMTGSGTLVDPAIAGNQLPYPICAN